MNDNKLKALVKEELTDILHEENPEQDHQYAIEAYHNMYKEIHGIRPRGEDFSTMSTEEIEDMTNELSDEYDRQSEMEPQSWGYTDYTSRDPWEDEPPAGLPLKPGEAEDWDQWVDKHGSR